MAHLFIDYMLSQKIYSDRSQCEFKFLKQVCMLKILTTNRNTKNWQWIYFTTSRPNYWQCFLVIFYSLGPENTGWLSLVFYSYRNKPSYCSCQQQNYRLFNIAVKWLLILLQIIYMGHKLTRSHFHYILYIHT